LGRQLPLLGVEDSAGVAVALALNVLRVSGVRVVVAAAVGGAWVREGTILTAVGVSDG